MPEAISRIDVGQGRLYFRGEDAIELAKTRSHEYVLYMLCKGHRPTPGQLKTLLRQMKMIRESMGSGAISIGSGADSCTAALIEQASVLDGLGIPTYGRLLAFVALVPVVVCAWWRQNQGHEPIAPAATLGHTANVLRMMDRAFADKDEKQFEICIIMHMDDPDNPSLHEMQHSLRSGGTIAQALAAALKEHINPLHHGAGSQAMNMLSELRKSENMRSCLEEWVNEGKKIYGLGHRMYKTIDPRAVALREVLLERTLNTPHEWLVATTDAVATIGSELLRNSKGKELFPNVDLYNAAVYSTFGLPAEFNTELFAISRAAGWMAHIIELEDEE